MARRAHHPQRVCDAPGCSVPVKRGMLMCRAHWFALPRHLRQAISESWAAKRIQDWSANCLEARNFIVRQIPGHPAHTAAVSAQQSYEMQQRLLGERPDA